MRIAFVLALALSLPMSDVSAQSAKERLATRILDAQQYETFAARMGAQGVAPDSQMSKHNAFLAKHIDRAEVRRRIIAAYVEHFTEEELTAIASFFEMPVGAKYQQFIPLIQVAVQPIYSAVFKEHAEEYRREVLGIPDFE
ncbi:MAG TPA: DUF2059 domain-containing protein [Gemmatimonadaceae bacterium]|nr:DUF2059 domain-containing protein [Gemmatimonadaceae bacterium]